MKTNRKKKTLNAVESHLSTPVKDKFIDFIEQHPARRVSLNLRRMLLEFLMIEHSVEAMYLNDLLYLNYWKLSKLKMNPINKKPREFRGFCPAEEKTLS
jgi:hypothetical protein